MAPPWCAWERRPTTNQEPSCRVVAASSPVAPRWGGLVLPQGKDFAIGANFGFFDSKQAFAAQTAVRLTDVLLLNGGVGVGMASSQVGGRVGMMAAW